MKKKIKKVILSVSLSIILIGGIVHIEYNNDFKSNIIYGNLSKFIIDNEKKFAFNESEINSVNDSQIEEVQDENNSSEEKTSNMTSSSNKIAVNNNSNKSTSNSNKIIKNQNSSKQSKVTTSNTVNKNTNSSKIATSNKINKNKKTATKSNSNTVKTTTSNNTSNSNNNNYNQNEAKKLLYLVNNYRKENGLKEVTWNNSLENSSKMRAKEIVQKFEHIRPDKTKYSTTINIKYKSSGENIAGGQMSAEEVFDSWLSSPAHKNNILSPKYNQMAVALYIDNLSEYKYYWVQIFIG